MIYTKEQAASIVCARVLAGGNIEHATDKEGRDRWRVRKGCSCADNGASQCSAWRWWDKLLPDPQGQPPSRGFCGPAGKPEHG